jgi:hypothetical protein
MALGPTLHIKLHIDPDGQLYIYDQNSGEKQLIQMRKNADGSKTSRAPASEIEDAIWSYRYDHKDSKKGAQRAESADAT